MKRILVLGATGFVGSRLVEKLVEKKYEVIAQGRKIKPWTPKCVEERLITIDFNKTEYELGEFDTVVNCLSVINPERNSWDEYSFSNCSIVYSILNKISCNKFIQLSTCSIFSRKSFFHNQPDPINLYGLSKYVSEKIVEIERKGKKSTILRFPIIIGKNKRSSDFVQYIINQAQIGKPIELHGEGLYFRNIIHVSEAVKAIISSVEADCISGFDTIEVGSYNTISIYDICKYLLEKTGSKSKVLLIDNKASTDFHAFINVSKTALIKYNCLSIENNLNIFIKELKL
jgi:UDP-glucose 4-epimerase